MAKLWNKIEMRKSLGDFFWKKCRQGMKRNEKESKRNDSRNYQGMSWTCLGQILDTPPMPSGCVRDAFGTAIEKIWHNAKEKSRLFCPEIRFLHPKTRLSIVCNKIEMRKRLGKNFSEKCSARNEKESKGINQGIFKE